MNKLLVGIVVLLVVLVGGFFALNSYIYKEKQGTTITSYKDAEFIIEGQRVKLENGFAESTQEGSVSKITTRYFGNLLETDLNNDTIPDFVFLLTQERGGSGIFYYAVAALQNEDGSYSGSDGYFLGDRIAPQTTEVSQNPRHKNVIVVNYAERGAGEPMTARPSMGKSAYLKLDPTSRQWGIVVPDFEGESR